MEGTVSLRWMNSFTATDLITYPLPKGRITFPLGKKT